jgi:hypothetical protein
MQYFPSLLPGWIKVHQYIYVLQHNTDDHGWQYRTEWSNGPLAQGDEPWVPVNQDGRNVRRRLWMTTVVRQDDIVNAKRVLSEALQAHRQGSIIQKELWRNEPNVLGMGATWQKRLAVLMDDKLDFFATNASGALEKKGEVPLKDCVVKMLFGLQCPGRDFAFSLRRPDGSGVILDAESREGRRRWVVHISYQLAIISPDVNFPPFDYGPPTGDEAATRILMCGELQKQGHMFTNWKTRFVTMTPFEIQVSSELTTVTISVTS